MLKGGVSFPFIGWLCDEEVFTIYFECLLTQNMKERNNLISPILPQSAQECFVSVAASQLLLVNFPKILLVMIKFTYKSIWGMF